MNIYTLCYDLGVVIIACCAGLATLGIAYGLCVWLTHLACSIALGIRDTIRSYSPIKHACRGYKPGRKR